MGALIFIIVIVAVILFFAKTSKTKRNSAEALIPPATINFNPNPVHDKKEYEEVKELLNRNYIPRTGSFEIEVYAIIIKPFQPGELLDLAFESKEAYYQSLYLDVAFEYNGTLIAEESIYYNESHPIIRAIRAHFSGYSITAMIKSVQDSCLTLSIQLLKDGQNLENKVNRGNSNKNRGKFDVVGYQYLPEEVKTLVWKELKEGDQLQLLADPGNQYDSKAIKVLYKDKQIGWVSKEYSRKGLLFEALSNNQVVNTTCITNVRQQGNRRIQSPDGQWLNQSTGMAQFVVAKYEMDKML